MKVMIIIKDEFGDLISYLLENIKEIKTRTIDGDEYIDFIRNGIDLYRYYKENIISFTIYNI